jgi:hypothetical protein
MTDKVCAEQNLNPHYNSAKYLWYDPYFIQVKNKYIKGMYLAQGHSPRK